MPTTNKRINLTLTDNVYARVLAYKQKNGITSDAAACLQLIVRQLDGIDNAERTMQLMSRFTMEEVEQIARVGFKTIQAMNEPKQIDEN